MTQAGKGADPLLLICSMSLAESSQDPCDDCVAFLEAGQELTVVVIPWHAYACEEPPEARSEVGARPSPQVGSRLTWARARHHGRRYTDIHYVAFTLVLVSGI